MRREEWTVRRQFEKFVMNTIVLLYPHAKKKTGMHVMLKVDSDPGRMNLNLLNLHRAKHASIEILFELTGTIGGNNLASPIITSSSSNPARR
jgi:hypothetical protein